MRNFGSNIPNEMIQRPTYKHDPRLSFTLIELLIVVAIIAILAAIAVPNFLEAQVRAKVSRAHSEMRALATAIESYAADYNQYPPHSRSNPNLTIIDDFSGLILLTTPIAYMTDSLMNDPFKDADAWNSNDNPNMNYIYIDFVYPDPHRYFDLFERPAAFPYYKGFYLKDPYTFPGPFRWMLTSYGPDRLLQLDVERPLVPNNVNAVYFPYDPTNGTVSFGDIHRMGPS